MNMLVFLTWLNDEVFALPATILFLGSGLFFTFKTGFLQLRAFPRFMRLLTRGIKPAAGDQKQAVNPFHALFTAMSTTIGMGSIVGPTVAIMSGGPGALFWMALYIFLSSATKFAEVVFALHTRTKTEDGYIIGGPTQYLKQVHPFLAAWYGSIMVFLFIGWSSMQANTLANIFALEYIPFTPYHFPHWLIGLALAAIVFTTLKGGAHRVGALASKLVPLMFCLYVSFALIVLFSDLTSLRSALQLIGQSIFSPAAAMGGFFGVSVFKTIQAGVYRGIYITESGLGTSSIPHSMADTKRSTDQGILAMYSAVADIFLSVTSGLLVLVTGVWVQGEFRSTLIYEAFKLNAPFVGRIILIASLTLFVLTTVIGNSFNGVQSFSSFTRHRWTDVYVWITVVAIFLGALTSMPLMWEIMDTLLTLVAIPNLIGILILAWRKPKVLTG